MTTCKLAYPFQVVLLAYIFINDMAPYYMCELMSIRYTAQMQLNRFTKGFVNMFYVFHLKHLQLRFMQNTGVYRCHFNICLTVWSIALPVITYIHIHAMICARVLATQAGLNIYCLGMASNMSGSTKLLMIYNYI